MGSIRKKKVLPDYGKHYGKYDLERWGDFGEMPYMHGVKYEGSFTRKLSDREKGKQMYGPFPKIKAGLQDCYFEKDFKRIFIGEAYKPLYKLDAQYRLERILKFRTPEGFRYPAFPKKISSPGDYYGTFAGKFEAFSAKLRPKVVSASPGRNFYTSPGKKGGAGYPQICINRFPEYISGDKYDTKGPAERVYSRTNPPFKGISPPSYFDKNPYPEPAGAKSLKPLYNKLVDEKWMRAKEFRPPGTGKPLGGHKGGCFSPFPQYMPSKYIDPSRIDRLGKKSGESRKIDFYPPTRNKTRAMFSVLNLNVDMRVNADNFAQMKPVTFTREILG